MFFPCYMDSSYHAVESLHERQQKFNISVLLLLKRWVPPHEGFFPTATPVHHETHRSKKMGCKFLGNKSELTVTFTWSKYIPHKSIIPSDFAFVFAHLPCSLNEPSLFNRTNILPMYESTNVYLKSAVYGFCTCFLRPDFCFRNF